MKLILDGAQGGKVFIHQADAKLMKAFTHGGFPGLPGDAITIDLDGDKRIEAAESMPKQRALDNMVRAGHKPAFAQKFIGSMLAGGETDASALDMVREKTITANVLTRQKYGITGTQSAIEPEDYLAMDRYFRDAWRRQGNGIVIDLDAAKIVVAKNIIAAKRNALSDFEEKKELAILTGEPEEAASALVSLDLRNLGQQIMAAKNVAELKALLP